MLRLSYSNESYAFLRLTVDNNIFFAFFKQTVKVLSGFLEISSYFTVYRLMEKEKW